MMSSFFSLPQLYTSLTALLRALLYHGPGTERDTLSTLLGPDFHKGLAKLLAKLVTQHHQEWREQSINTMVAPPKLIDFGNVHDTPEHAAAHGIQSHALRAVISGEDISTLSFTCDVHVHAHAH